MAHDRVCCESFGKNPHDLNVRATSPHYLPSMASGHQISVENTQTIVGPLIKRKLLVLCAQSFSYFGLTIEELHTDPRSTFGIQNILSTDPAQHNTSHMRSTLRMQ